MTTTISATVSVRVRGGLYTPEAAAAVAAALGGGLGPALAAAPLAVADVKRKRAASPADER